MKQKIFDQMIQLKAVNSQKELQNTIDLLKSNYKAESLKWEKLKPEHKEELALSIFKHFEQPEDGHTPTKDELLSLIQPLIPTVEDGHTPTEDEIKAIIEPMIPDVKNGITPQKGLDYFTKKDIKEIVDIIVDRTKIDTDKLLDEKKIVAKINKSNEKIDAKNIKGIPDQLDFTNDIEKMRVDVLGMARNKGAIKVTDDGGKVGTFHNVNFTNAAITHKGDEVTVDVGASAGGGQVNTVVGGTLATVDSTDPVNPIVNVEHDSLVNLTDTELESTANGDILYMQDDKWKSLAVGSNDQHLIVESGMPTWSDQPAAGSSTLKEVGDATTTTANGTYTIANNQDVAFEDQGGDNILLMDESDKSVHFGPKKTNVTMSVSDKNLAANGGFVIYREAVPAQSIQFIPNDNTRAMTMLGGGNAKFFLFAAKTGAYGKGIAFGTDVVAGVTGTSTVRMTVLDTSTVNIGFGIADSGARLGVMAQGSASSDQAFLVRNSADTADLMAMQGDGTLNMPNLPEYTTDVAAGTGGLNAGDVYQTSTGELRIKL